MDALMRRALITGGLGGIAGIHVSLVGMVDTFQGRDTIADVITLGSMMPILILLLVGWRAASPPRTVVVTPSGSRSLLLGAAAGATGGLILAALAVAITAVNFRWILVNATPGLAEILQFGQGPLVGSLVLILGGGALGVVGASLHVLPAPIARSLAVAFVVTLGASLLEPFLGPVLRNLSLDVLEDVFFASGGLTPVGFAIIFALTAAGVYAWATRGERVRTRVAAMPDDRRRNAKLVWYGVLFLLLLALPQLVGQRLSEVVGTVGLYVLLGLGLNIVVGFAGLLDLGYVAFYAVGAYTTAVLTSPGSPAFSPELPFWGALPFVIIAAALIGLMVGTPVLRLRGDYLAIVTLGFGEIARTVFLSAWAQPVVGRRTGDPVDPAAASVRA